MMPVHSMLYLSVFCSTICFFIFLIYKHFSNIEAEFLDCTEESHKEAKCIFCDFEEVTKQLKPKSISRDEAAIHIMRGK